MTYFDIKVELLSFWHCGTGLSQGNAIDLACQRDANGLPYVPGRTLKGLLRDVMEPSLAALFFGHNTENERSTFGLLRVSDARLPHADIVAISNDEQKKQLLASLFRVIYQTAIENETGVASNKALRAIEVAVPIELYARIGALPGTSMPNNWTVTIAALLPSITALGAHRSRGFGRCTITPQIGARQ